MPLSPRLPSVRGWISRIVNGIQVAGLRQLAPRLPFEARITYSQFGEDIVIGELTRNDPPGFYVDIGAWHPIAKSNTYALYTRGWRGINVEPRPGAIADFDSTRPRDINVACCIAPDKVPEVTFYLFDRTCENTTVPEVAQKRVDEGFKLLEKRSISALTLVELFERYLPKGTAIDFLSIDAEGLDADIVRSNDWRRYTPRIILLEEHVASLENLGQLPVVNYLEAHGYKLAAKCGPSIIMKHSGASPQYPNRDDLTCPKLAL